MCSYSMQSEFHTQQQDRVTKNALRNILSPFKDYLLRMGPFSARQPSLHV